MHWARRGMSTGEARAPRVAELGLRSVDTLKRCAVKPSAMETWTTERCADEWGIAVSTWRSYVATGRASAAARLRRAAPRVGVGSARRTLPGQPSPGEASGWFYGVLPLCGAGRAVRRPRTTMHGPAASAERQAD